MADSTAPPTVDTRELARLLQRHPADVVVTEAAASWGRWSYGVSGGGEELELRRARDPAPAGALDVVAESELLARLRRAGMAAPVERGCSDDAAICGGPLLLTHVIPGHRLERRLPPSYPRTSTTRHDISAAMVQQLVALHSLDPVGLGLSAADETATERALAGWWASGAGLPDGRSSVIGELHDRLSQSVPPLSGWALLHNSFHLGNLVYSNDRPDIVVGLVNWEMAAAGDPLCDLGYLLACWPDDPDDPSVLATGVSLTCDDGFFSRSTVIHEYTMRRGSNLQHLNWYVAFGYLRLAVVTEARRLREGGGVPSRSEDDAEVQLVASGLSRLDGH